MTPSTLSLLLPVLFNRGCMPISSMSTLPSELFPFARELELNFLRCCGRVLQGEKFELPA